MEKIDKILEETELLLKRCLVNDAEDKIKSLLSIIGIDELNKWEIDVIGLAT